MVTKLNFAQIERLILEVSFCKKQERLKFINHVCNVVSKHGIRKGKATFLWDKFVVENNLINN